jgi:hypothetical protein
MPKQDKKSKSLIVRIVLYALFGAVAVSSFSLFLYYNNRSREAVQAEREDYTSEITIQLTRNIESVQDAYVSEVQEAARFLDAFKPKTYADLASVYPDSNDHRHFLIETSGKTYDSSGNQCTFSDEYFKTNLASSAAGTVVLSHCLVDMEESYLLFGEELADPVTMGGTSYSAFALGVTAAQFRKNMTISLQRIGLGLSDHGRRSDFREPRRGAIGRPWL